MGGAEASRRITQERLCLYDTFVNMFPNCVLKTRLLLQKGTRTALLYSAGTIVGLT